MKIWYVCKYAESPDAGDLTYGRPFGLAKAMAKEGENVTLICSRSNGRKAVPVSGLYRSSIYDNVKCVVLNGPLIELGFSIKRIFSWILFEFNFLIYALTRKKADRPDVLIASSLSILTFITATWLKYIFRCKLIVEVRDIWPEAVICSGKFSRSNIFVKFLKVAELTGYRNANAFISPIPHFGDYVKSQINKSVRFTCITQGFDGDKIKPATKSVQYNDVFEEQVFKVCYIGAIGNVNCVNVILDAAVRLHDNFSIKFIIMGFGPLKEYYVNKYRDYTNIIFLNPVPKECVNSIIQRADLLVNAWGDYDMYNYGVSPNKWIDYMLSARPILVAFNGYQSMINEAQCGWFVEANNPGKMAEKILEISKMDKTILDQMGRNGKEWVMNNCEYNRLGRNLLSFIYSL